MSIQLRGAGRTGPQPEASNRNHRGISSLICGPHVRLQCNCELVAAVSCARDGTADVRAGDGTLRPASGTAASTQAKRRSTRK